MRRALLAAALALAALALPGPGPAGAQGLQPDLAVTHFALTGPLPEWVDGMANATTLQATVSNTGGLAAGYELRYWWAAPDGTRTPLNGEAGSFDTGSSLDPGESRTHPAPWIPQEIQVGNGTLLAEVSPSTSRGPNVADPDLEDNVRRLPVFVPAHGLSFSIPNVPATAPADGAAFFRLAARNAGNVPEAVPLRIVNPPNDTRLQPFVDPPVLTVPANGDAHATIYLRYEPAGDFTPFSTRLTVEADPRFAPAVHLLTPLASGGPENTSVAGFAFEASATSAGTLLAPRGADTPATLVVTNTGTRPDNYTVALAASGGWVVLADPPRVALYPEESAVVTLRVRPPPEAPAGATSAIEARVKGSRLPAPATVALQALVPGASLSVDEVRLDGSLYTGQAPRVLVAISNHGDQPAPSGSSLQLSVHVPGAAPQALQATLGRIGAGQSLVTSFVLEPLAVGGPGRVEATVETPSGARSPPLGASFLVHAPALSLLPPDPQSGGPGETVAYRLAPRAFVLVNVGNAPETVTLEARAASGQAAVEGSPTVHLAPGQSRTLSILHTLPRPLDGRAASNLTVAARIEGHPGVSWEASVATRLADHEDPRLLPRALPPLWTLDRPLPLDLAAGDDDRVASANATVTGPGGNRTVVALQPDGDGTRWRGEVGLPEPGNYTVTFSAADPAGNSAATPPAAVEARHVPPPALAFDGLDAAAGPHKLNGTGHLRVLVEDARPVRNVTLEVHRGPTVLRRTLPVTAGTADVDLASLGSGPVRLVVLAQNDAGAEGRAEIQLDVAEVPRPRGPADGPEGRDAPAAGGMAAAALTALLGLLERQRRPPRRGPGADTP